MRLAFIDTALWFEFLKDEDLYQRFENYLLRNEITPVIHPLLELEIFQGKKVEQFETLWSFIQHRVFFYLSPIKIPEVEITEIYENGKVEGNVLKMYPFDRLTSSEKAIKKRDLFTNAHLNAKKSRENEGSEDFQKASLKSLWEIKDRSILELIYRLQIHSDHQMPEHTQLERIAKELTSKDKKFGAKKDQYMNSVFSRMRDEYSTSNMLKWIFEYLQFFQFTESELKDLKLIDYIRAGSKSFYLKETFELNGYRPTDWGEYIKTFKNEPFQNYRGWSISQSVAERIRLSEAKSKISDDIDFHNLCLIPYVDLYVADAHISSEVKGLYKDRWNIMSIKEFMVELKKYPSRIKIS